MSDDVSAQWTKEMCLFGLTCAAVAAGLALDNYNCNLSTCSANGDSSTRIDRGLFANNCWLVQSWAGDTWRACGGFGESARTRLGGMWDGAHTRLIRGCRLALRPDVK